MNAVLILARNNWPLTARCIRSVMEQDIPAVSIFVVDNDSTDGTREMLKENRIPYARFSPQIGVSAGWNYGLEQWFRAGAQHVFVINNDATLPSWFFRKALSYKQWMVTGIAVDNMQQIQKEPEPSEPTPNPDFSAFLIRRPCWDIIGKFDERMKLYASDCDYHVRAHRKGVELVKANIPYYHERSSTLRLSKPTDRAEIERQANADRQVFKSIYGCVPGEPGYEELFK